MHLSTKHADQQTVSRYDFTGGLNTATAAEMIAENELTKTINMEIDQSTKLLRVVSGTKTVYKPADIIINSAIYDKINKKWLLVDMTNKVYVSDLTSHSLVGTLTGTLTPIAEAWEDGILISSGARMQYYNGTDLITIHSSFSNDETNWKMITPMGWVANKAYIANDIVVNNGVYYQCITTHTSTSLAADAANWTVLNYIGNWNLSTDYAVNDIVVIDSIYYRCTTAHTSPDDSPSVSNGVYIKGGRVMTFYNDYLDFSGTGDETNWVKNDNDDSASKGLQIGYKDSGNIIGVVNLYDDIIVLKDNNRLYRITGNYPNWVVTELSRNIDCRSRLSYCAMPNNVFILGKDKLQEVAVTQEYGDMKATNVASKVESELVDIQPNAHLRYIPPLNQIWIIGANGKIIMYDCNYGSFFIRQFNSNVLDVISVNDDVYIIKSDRISILSVNHFYDDEVVLKWSFKAQRLISQHDYLLKRVQVSITPKFETYCEGRVFVGNIVTTLPMPFYLRKIYKNKAITQKNKSKIYSSARMKGISSCGDKVYNNYEPIYGGNKTKIYSIQSSTVDQRCVYRNKLIDIQGYGSGGCFILNRILFDLVEV